MNFINKGRSASTISIDQKPHNTSRVRGPTFCTNLWSEIMLPRIEARPFGVPNKRSVLFAKKLYVGRVELLIEVSKTDNGKFFIVVF